MMPEPTTSQLVTEASIVCLPILAIASISFFPVHVRSGIWFGVSVPVDFPQSARGRQMRSAYRLRSIAFLLMALTIATIGLLRGIPLLLPGAVLFELLAVYASWWIAFRAARPFAVQPALVRAASLNQPHSPIATMLLQALAFLPLIFSGLYLRLHWAQIPERFPRHWNSVGQPDGWSARTPAGVFGPLLFGVALFVFIYSIQAFLAYGRGRSTRVAWPVMTAVAWLISVVFSVAAVMPLQPKFVQGPLTLLWVIIAGMLLLFSTIGYMVWKLAAEPKLAYDGTPDSAWHGAIFYYNRQDSALFVTKRFGYGWTLNFAHPLAWLWLLVALLPVLGVIIFKAVHA